MDKSTKAPIFGPLHVYRGGNFVRIGAEGYDEYVEKESYLGGPLCIAEVRADREDYSYDGDLALARAEEIVHRVNCYDDLLNCCRLALMIVRPGDCVHGDVLRKNLEEIVFKTNRKRAA